MQFKVGATRARETDGRLVTKAVACALAGSLALGGCGLSQIELTPAPTSISQAEAESLRKDVVLTELGKKYADLPTLLEARERAFRTSESVDNKNEWNKGVHIGLDVLTFGLAAAGGVAAIYDAHNDIVLALGLGALGAKTGNSLYFSLDRTAIFDSAKRALSCVSGTSDGVATGYDSARKKTAPGGALDQKLQRLKSALLQPELDESDAELFAAANAAIAGYATLLGNIAAFGANEGTFATAVNKTVDLIVGEANLKLLQIFPTPEQIFTAASGIAGAAVSYGKQVTPTPPAPAGGGQPKIQGLRGGVTKEHIDQRIELATATSELASETASVQSSIDTATNAVGDIALRCVVDYKVPEKFVLIGANAVTVERTKTINVKVSGGKKPLTFEWKDKKDGGIAVVPSIAVENAETWIFALTPGATAPQNTPVTLIIKDAKPAPDVVEVVVTVK